MAPNVVTIASVAMSVALLASGATLPSTTPKATAAVRHVSATIPTAYAPDNSPLPSDLTNNVKSFLHKYQSDATAAATHAKAGHLHDFPNEGFCTREFPCLSISRVGLGDFDSGFTLTVAQMEKLLDTVQSKGEITFDQASHPKDVLSGATIETTDLTLEVIAPAGNITSHLLAGTVFDMFKAQGLRDGSNAVRAVGIGGGSDGQATMALCVFPSCAAGNTTTNFCYGKELDGTRTTAPVRSPTLRTRDFSIVGTICGLIDIPLLCPSM